MFRNLKMFRQLKLSALIIALMILSIVAISCSAETPKDNSDKSEETHQNLADKADKDLEKSEDEEPDDEGGEYTLPLVTDGSVKITYAGVDNWYPPASYADNLPVWQEVERRTGVEVQFDVLPSNQYHTAMSTRMASGENLPDVVMIPNSDAVRYGVAGLIIPLEDLFEKYAPNITKLIYEDEPILGKIFTAPDGHIYNVAEIFIGQNAVAPKSLIVRKDWLDKLNHDIPTTVDDWYTVLKDFKEKDPNGNEEADEIPFTAFSGLGEYGYLASGFGLPAPVPQFFADANGKVQYSYTMQEFRDLLTFLNKLYGEKLLDPQYSTGGDEAKVDAMVAKDIVGVCAHFATVESRWDNILIEAGVDDVDYRLIPPPQGPDGTLQQIMRTPTGAQFGITKDCENVDIVVKWLDYIYASEEGVDLLAYGIEGDTWEYDGDKKMLNDWTLNNPDGLDIISALRSTGAFPALFTNRKVDFYVQVLEEKSVESAEQIMPNLVEPFPQVLPLPEESERIASLSAEINTYADEMIQKFIMGQRDLDEFDKFVQQLESMNLEELIRIKQTQYDRFQSN